MIDWNSIAKKFKEADAILIDMYPEFWTHKKLN